MNLALKYRPKEFSDVVGQKAISVVLQAMINKNQLDQVLLFTGPSGVGKTSMARIIAAQLNSEGAAEVHEGTHPAVLEIDAASNGSVAALRQLKKDLNYSIAGHRVVILDEAHAISDEGKAVLLNLLEFPPDNVTFILITTEAHEIPETVQHRCDTYHFRKASVADLTERLSFVAEKEGILLDSELLNLIAQRSEGSFRESLMLLKQVWVGGITTVEQYQNLHGDFDYGPNLLKSALKGPFEAAKALETALYHISAEDISSKIVETLRDLMLIKGDFEVDFVGDMLNSRTFLASQLSPAHILKSIRIMWDLQTKLGNADPIRGLEMAFSLIAEVIGTTPSEELSRKSMEAHIAQRSNESQPMSLDRLRNFKG
jgi:DNA polymerase III subunit gamma/tau